MAEPLPKVTDITRWEYRPGDRLIARVDRDVVTEEQAQAIGARLRATLHLPPEAPIAIATPEWTFEVISETDAA